MVEVKIEFPQDPTGQAVYLRCAESLLSSHRTTQRNIDAHNSGERNSLREKGFDFFVAHTLYGNIYTRNLAPSELKEPALAITQSWDEIRNPHLSQLVMENPDLKYPGEGDPGEYIINLWKDCSDQKLSRIIDDTYDSASVLALQDPKALPLLQSQFELEKKLLNAMVPLWQKTSASEYKSHWHYEREPRSVDQAIDIVKGSHHGTEVTREYYETQGKSLVEGGFGRLYGLLKQDKYFASLFTPDQLKSAKDYLDGWRLLRLESYRLALRKSFHVAIDDTSDPFPITDSWSVRDQDTLAEEARDILIKDLDTLGHVTSQSKYEMGLLDHLERLKNGDSFPKPETPEQAFSLLEMSHRWTRINLETIGNHTWGGWIGGFRRYYDLLSQESIYDNLLPKDLTDEGRTLFVDYKTLKENLLRMAITKNWGIDIGSLDPETFMQDLWDASIKISFSQNDYFVVRERELGDMLNSSELLTHLTNQFEYEEKALRYLS